MRQLLVNGRDHDRYADCLGHPHEEVYEGGIARQGNLMGPIIGDVRSTWNAISVGEVLLPARRHQARERLASRAAAREARDRISFGIAHERCPGPAKLCAGRSAPIILAVGQLALVRRNYRRDQLLVNQLSPSLRE